MHGIVSAGNECSMRLLLLLLLLLLCVAVQGSFLVRCRPQEWRSQVQQHQPVLREEDRPAFSRDHNRLVRFTCLLAVLLAVLASSSWLPASGQ
jgi:hypothetical protein